MTRKILQEERRWWKKGFKRVVGLDESGRGPLAGPVLAAAVKSDFPLLKNFRKSDFVHNRASEGSEGEKEDEILFRLKDSKKLTPKKREEFYKILTKHPNIEWGTGRVSEKVIDKINILEATKLAMIRAIEKLKIKNKKLKIDYLILDGNFKIDLPIPQKSIVKADGKVFSCMAAGIIAKVTRDRIMQNYHKKYPRYGFNQHKGYPTKLHLKMLQKHGPAKIHRKTFGPLKRFF